MKVLVCGSRTWKDAHRIREILSRLPRDTEIIHGDARGADKLAATVARSLGFTVTAFAADWTTGRRAGLDRNLVMLDQKPDLVIAFWDGASTGTAHTIRHAQMRGIPVRVIRS